jgi:DGQHR domain-containing protein
MAKTTTPPKKKVKKKKVLSADEKGKLKREKKLHADILSFFKTSGFEYISTNGKEKKFGTIPGELDGVYFYKNVIVIIEETIGSDNDHLRTKVDYFQKIKENKEEFLQWISQLAPDKFGFPTEYTTARYHLIYCYASETLVSEDISERYPEVKFLGPLILKYFLHLARSIRYSSRNEFFKFLGLGHSDIGDASSSTQPRYIDSAVIVPEAGTGFPEGINIVTFVMKAQELLDCAYVFRKDSWESAIGQYYQRLVDKSKIDKIRSYLASSQRTFIDNIVVTLPEGTSFTKLGADPHPPEINIKDLSSISNVQIRIPYLINSIGIIDGQHRVFGHYHGGDHLEKEIARHRDRRHLFVTGILYNSDKYKESDKRIFESGLFLLMNNNQNKVKPDLLQYIETLKSPRSSLGIAGNVLMTMNNRDPFKNLFLLSPLDKVGIKTPTIVKYGLQGLVELSVEKETIFKYWVNDNKLKLLDERYDESLYQEYIKFCAVSLSQYFNGLKSQYKDIWDLSNKNSRILTSTAIVAFLKSYASALTKYQEVNDFLFFKDKFEKLTIEFTKDDFSQYGSSHWPRLAARIDLECWV